MNKVFQFGCVVLAVLALALTACEQPQLDSMTNTDKVTTLVGLQTLSPPDNVIANAYGPTGVIRVAWDPVANAQGYMLYRKSVDSNGKAAVVYINQTFDGIHGTNRDLYYDDVISFQNEFKAGTNYTYRVVAYSNYASNSTSPGQAGGGWTTIATDEWFFIENSYKDSNAVSFSNLLAQGSKLAAPQNVKLTQGVTTNTSGSYGKQDNIAQVSWPVERGVNYIVSYGVNGQDAVNYPRTLKYYIPGSSIGQMQETYAVNIPLVFGEVYVEVIAESSIAGLATTDISSGSSTALYYLQSEPAVVTGNFARTMLDTPTAFTVTENYHTVNLSWDKMQDAESYKVYRYKYQNNAYNTGGNQIYEGWKDITTEIGYYEEAGTIYGKTTTLDLYIETGTRYEYMVISVNGDLVSLPATTTTARTYTAPALTASFNTTTDWDVPTLDWTGITVSWTANNKQTYKLYRTALKLAEDLTTYVPANGSAEFVYDAVDITGIDKDLIDGKTYTKVDKQAAYRNFYRYKLEAYDESDSTTPIDTSYSGVINQFPYRYNELPITLSVQPSTSKLYQIEYRLATPSIEQLKRVMRTTEIVRISRANANASGERTGDYKLVQDISLDKFGGNTYTSLNDDDTGTGYFIYKAEVIEGNAMSATLNAAAGKPTFVTTTAYPASDPKFSAFSLTASTTNGKTTFKLTNSSYSYGIEGTKLLYCIGSPAGADSEIKTLILSNKLGTALPTTPVSYSYSYDTSANEISVPRNTYVYVYVVGGDYMPDDDLPADLDNTSFYITYP